MPMIKPVILCGGGGLRLWPASTPGLPKSFLRIGGATLFARALARGARLSDARPLVIGSVRDADLIRGELRAADLAADLLLEPSARNTAPAMIAAALSVARDAPDAVLVFLPSDHHIADEPRFAVAVGLAADCARDGALALIGMTPGGPSSAYGHIRPLRPGRGPSPVAQFVEKPPAAVAARLVQEGCLWNSGVLVTRADALIAEAERHLPAAVTAVRAALGPSDVLGDDFQRAPNVAMDTAVLEKTDRAWVVPADVGWSDLGAWDTVAEIEPSRSNATYVAGGDRVWVQAPPGVSVAAVGVSDLLIVVGPGGDVLVCARDAVQQVKDAASALRSD